MKELEKLLKAVANRRRLAILAFLTRRPQASVGVIAKAIRLSFKSTSKHLNILFGVDILEREQQSLKMFYRLPPTQNPIIRTLLQSL